MLHALDLPLPADLEGQLPEEALRSDALALRPARRRDAAVQTAAVADVVLDEAAEAEILDRLRALGYVE
jgi:hypothetical protein